MRRSENRANNPECHPREALNRFGPLPTTLENAIQQLVGDLFSHRAAEETCSSIYRLSSRQAQQLSQPSKRAARADANPRGFVKASRADTTSGSC